MYVEIGWENNDMKLMKNRFLDCLWNFTTIPCFKDYSNSKYCSHTVLGLTANEVSSSQSIKIRSHVQHIHEIAAPIIVSCGTYNKHFLSVTTIQIKIRQASTKTPGF